MELLPKGTKTKINSTEPYIQNFNGQTATAEEKVGLVSNNQAFNLTNGGTIYLNKEDFAVV